VSGRGYVLFIICCVVAFIVLVSVLSAAERAARRRKANKEAPQPSANPPRPASASRRGRPLLVAGLVAALVIVGVGVGVLVMTRNRAVVANWAQRLDKLQVAYEAVVAIQAATGVGVTYPTYGPRLADAATALAIYEAEDNEAREVASQLVEALNEYKYAGEAWSIKIQDSDSAWQAFARAHPDVISRLGIDDYSAGPDIDKAIQYFWLLADVHMEAARKGLAAYKRHSG